MRPLNTYGKQELVRRQKTDRLIHIDVPYKLKAQLFHIWNAFFCQSKMKKKDEEDFWDIIYVKVCEEVGVKTLYTGGAFGPRLTKRQQIEKYFDEERDVMIVLHILETILFAIRVLAENDSMQYTCKEVIADVNQRCLENGFGFRYDLERETIIRLDNEMTYVQTMQPALKLLNDPLYENASEEFNTALDHYKNGRNKEALFESARPSKRF